MKKIFIIFTLCSFITTSIFAREYYFKIDRFNLPSPSALRLIGPLTLWATNYYLPEIKSIKGKTSERDLIALRDIAGNKLGPVVSLEDWCRSAMEGSVRVLFKKARARTYNYFSDSEEHAVDCSRFYEINVGKSKFKIARGPFGDGINNYQLNPFRTIATDPKVIPSGSVVFIPDARGARIELPNGQRFIHDGYFFAGDIGGGIKENHIDVFSGIFKRTHFFPWITSSERGLFEAFIVKDKKIINKLTRLHR